MGYNRISVNLARWVEEVLPEEPQCEMVHLRITMLTCRERTEIEKDWCHICRKVEATQ